MMSSRREKYRRKESESMFRSSVLFIQQPEEGGDSSSHSLRITFILSHSYVWSGLLALLLVSRYTISISEATPLLVLVKLLQYSH